MSKGTERQSANIRMPAEIWCAAKVAAARRGLSLNAFVIQIIDEHPEVQRAAEWIEEEDGK